MVKVVVEFVAQFISESGGGQLEFLRLAEASAADVWEDHGVDMLEWIGAVVHISLGSVHSLGRRVSFGVVHA